MKICDYYNCTDYIEDENIKGFLFCKFHVQHLEDLMDYDEKHESEFVNSLGYCLSSLNSKAYKNSILVL